MPRTRCVLPLHAPSSAFRWSPRDVVLHPQASGVQEMTKAVQKVQMQYGHNVTLSLQDILKAHNQSVLYVFNWGTEKLLENNALEILDTTRLAGTFVQYNCRTKVADVYVLLNGDLRNQLVETTVGIDRLCKVNSQLVSNVCLDVISTGQYYHFVCLMGRRVSHVVFKCALPSVAKRANPKSLMDCSLGHPMVIVMWTTHSSLLVLLLLLLVKAWAVHNFTTLKVEGLLCSEVSLASSGSQEEDHGALHGVKEERWIFSLNPSSALGRTSLPQPQRAKAKNGPLGPPCKFGEPYSFVSSLSSLLDTLIFHPDGTYTILIANVEKQSGNIYEHWDIFSLKQFKNPIYQGKWKAPMIDNLEFKDNPYTYAFDSLKCIGIELWQTVAEWTWGKHKDAEKAVFDEAETKKEEDEASKDEDDLDDEDAEDEDKANGSFP